MKAPSFLMTARGGVYGRMVMVRRHEVFVAATRGETSEQQVPPVVAGMKHKRHDPHKRRTCASLWGSGSQILDLEGLGLCCPLRPFSREVVPGEDYRHPIVDRSTVCPATSFDLYIGENI